MTCITRIGTLLVLAGAAAAAWTAAAAEPAAKAADFAEVDRLRPRMSRVNQAIWGFAEPGLEERR